MIEYYQNETFQVVDGFPNYIVSNKGNVYNLSRRCSKVKPQPDGRGYYNIVLYNDGVGYTFKQHRIVMEHFGPVKPSDNHVIDHKDNQTWNNEESNLQWMTRKENLAKSRQYRAIVGAKLTPRMKSIIQKLDENRVDHTTISEVFQIDARAVRRVVNNGR